MSSESDPVVMIIGRLGSGKSTLGNAFLGKNCFQVSNEKKREVVPDTEVEYGSWRGDQNNGQLWVLDTPGHDDIRGKDRENREDVVKQLKKRKGVHAFVLVIKAEDRLGESDKKSLEIVAETFGGKEEFSKRLVVVLSFYGFSESAEKKRGKLGKPLFPDLVSSYNQDIQMLMGIDCPHLSIMAIDAGYDPEDERESSKFDDGMNELWAKIRNIHDREGMCSGMGFKVVRTKDEKKLLAVKNGHLAFQAFDEATRGLSRTLAEMKKVVDEYKTHSSNKKGSRVRLSSLGLVAGGLGIGSIFFPPLFIAAAITGGVVATVGTAGRSIGSKVRETELKKRTVKGKSDSEEEWEALETALKQLEDLHDVPELDEMLKEFQTKMRPVLQEIRNIRRDDTGSQSTAALEHVTVRGRATAAAAVATTAGGLFCYVDDLAAGSIAAAGGAARVVGPVLGAIGAGFAIMDFGLAIREVVQNDPTIDQLEKLAGMMENGLDLCEKTFEKVKAFHWKVVNEES